MAAALDPTALWAAVIAFCGLVGGMVFGLGRQAARVDVMEQRLNAEVSQLHVKLDGKTDNTQFASLHADVREVRDLLIKFMQKQPQRCPCHPDGPE